MMRCLFFRFEIDLDLMCLNLRLPNSEKSKGDAAVFGQVAVINFLTGNESYTQRNTLSGQDLFVFVKQMAWLSGSPVSGPKIL